MNEKKYYKWAIQDELQNQNDANRKNESKIGHT